MRTRIEIVEEALTWVGTPFHARAAVKGAGVECGWLIFGVLRDLGMLPQGYSELNIPEYSQQFWAHRDDEIYLDGIVKIGYTEISRFPPKPADVVLVKMGRLFAHGGIVVDWPKIVHSNPDSCKVTVSSAEHHRVFIDKPKKFFTLFPEES